MPSTLVTTVNETKATLAKELPADSMSEEATERCRDMLQRLDELPITVEVLSETLVGTVVSKFKSNTRLGPTAKALIKKWKKLAKESGVAGSSKTAKLLRLDSTASTSSAAAAAQELKKSTSIMDRRDSTASASSTGGGGAALTAEKEWADLPPLRKNICTKMRSLLELSKPDLIKSGFNADAVSQLCISRASEVETAIQTKAARSATPENNRQVYTEKARQLAFNLKKNAQLRQQILMATLSADELVNMSSEQLATSEKAQERAKMVHKLQDSRRLDWEQANEEKINQMCGIKGELLSASLFTCGRCKSTKTTSTQKQTRSADEPMTVFVLCMNCGKRWKC